MIIHIIQRKWRVRRAGGGRWQIWGCEKGDEERKYKKKVGNLMMA